MSLSCRYFKPASNSLTGTWSTNMYARLATLSSVHIQTCYSVQGWYVCIFFHSHWVKGSVGRSSGPESFCLCFLLCCHSWEWGCDGVWVLGQQLQVLLNQVRYVHRLAFEPLSLGVFMNFVWHLSLGWKACFVWALVYDGTSCSYIYIMLSSFSLITISTIP